MRLRRRAFAHLTGGRRELLLFLAAYAVYDGARWLAKGDAAAARAHAHWIADIERSAGVGIEQAIQQGFGSGVWSELLSNVYLAAQLAVLPCALISLYRWAPAVYRHLRNTILATWLIAIPIFAAYPVAPPRLADPAMADTVSRLSRPSGSRRASSRRLGHPLAGRSTLALWVRLTRPGQTY